jgi:transposase
MAGPYLQDFRIRVVTVVENGHSARSAAKLFAVSPSSAIKWVQRWRREGSLAPRPARGHRRQTLATHSDWLLEVVELKSDLTLEKIRVELCNRGVNVSIGTVWNFYDRHGISFRKNRARKRTGLFRRDRGVVTIPAGAFTSSPARRGAF